MKNVGVVIKVNQKKEKPMMGKGVSNDSSSVMTLKPHAYNATEFSVGLTTDAPSAMSSLPSRGTFLKWFVF